MSEHKLSYLLAYNMLYLCWLWVYLCFKWDIYVNFKLYRCLQ